MKVLFLGGDKRQLEIINHLFLNGHKIDVVGYEKANLNDEISKKVIDEINISDYKVVFLPISGVKDDFLVACDFSDDKIKLPKNLFCDLDNKSLIFTGIHTKNLDEMLKIADKNVIALMDEADVKKANSIPTVEGIIGDLVYNTDYTINGANIFILGYGNVGTVLTEKLKALGANITVGVLLFEEYKKLTDNNVNCIYTNNKLLMNQVMQDNEIIINTVPDLIINKDYLKVVNKNAYILDISSDPHGVNFDSANELQIKNKLLLGIPAKVAPKTAGQILVNKIDSILERSK